ncbi:unnamed protein product [Caenorhabditis nigoni]
MMSLNRATSIFFYFNNEKIWKFLLPILTLLIVIVMTIGTRTILSTVPYYTYNSVLDMYTIKSDSFVLQLDPSRTSMLGQIAQVVLPFASDFLTISQPYVLIFLSSKVRAGFMQMYLKHYAATVTSMGFTKTGGFKSGAASRSTSQVTRF